MDGAGSGVQDSETNTSGYPHPVDVGFALRNVQAPDAQGDTKNSTTSVNLKPTTSGVNVQLEKVDEVNRQGEMHPSVMYPARAHLYLGRPRSLQDGQRPVPCSLHPPRGLSQETKSENDVGVLDDALRIRRPLQFANTCVKEIFPDAPADQATLEMPALNTFSRDPYLPSPENQPSSPGPNNILGQDGAMRSPNRGPEQRGYLEEDDKNPDATER